MSKLVGQRHFVLKHGEYKPEAQASESAQLIHSLALRACTVLPGGAVQLARTPVSRENPKWVARMAVYVPESSKGAVDHAWSTPFEDSGACHPARRVSTGLACVRVLNCPHQFCQYCLGIAQRFQQLLRQSLHIPAGC